VNKKPSPRSGSDRIKRREKKGIKEKNEKGGIG
jgi:hypothetical protein